MRKNNVVRQEMTFLHQQQPEQAPTGEQTETGIRHENVLAKERDRMAQRQYADVVPTHFQGWQCSKTSAWSPERSVKKSKAEHQNCEGPPPGDGRRRGNAHKTNQEPKTRWAPKNCWTGGGEKDLLSVCATADKNVNTNEGNKKNYKLSRVEEAQKQFNLF